MIGMRDTGVSASNAGDRVSTKQVIVIRHAQKPTSHPKHLGVREDGTSDPESLTVRGWLHAGAIAAVFGGPGSHPVEAHLERPEFIFAAGAGKKRVVINGRSLTVGSHSRRPLETVTPMAERLGLMPLTIFTKGEEKALVADVISRGGVVLICWQHQDIPTIGNLILGNDTTVPQSWPEDRYDLIWVFDRNRDAWSFRQFHHARLFSSLQALAGPTSGRVC